MSRSKQAVDVKSFDISKRVVFEAWQKVKANGGAAGVDGQSITEFEKDLQSNLYRVWNRMSSGTYFPPAVRAVEIPKAAGGVRILGVPTVSDRVAQTVVRSYLEPVVEPLFHPDSYGYRPGRSALDAVGTCRDRCWKNDWVIDLDIRAFGIRRGVDFMLDDHQPIRPAINSLVSAIRSWQDCTKTAAWFGPGPLVVCQFKLFTVKDRGQALGAVLHDNAQLLAEKFVDNPESKTPAILFDESRNFYHPKANGFAVMACGVRAVYKAQNPATCTAANAANTFVVNGGPITNRTPIRLVPDPFGHWLPFTFTLNGWKPGSTVYMVARSQQVDLGSVTADTVGSVSGSVQLPSTLSTGIHRVVFSGDAAGGAARTVQLYVDVPGRPTNRADYSVYLTGLAPNETATVSYGGIDLGEYSVNADGGLWLTLPIGIMSTVNDTFAVTATGRSSNRSVTRRFYPVPVRTAGGIWATGTTTDAVTIDGNNADLGSLVHSDGGIIVTGNNDAGVNAEHASGLTMPGNRSQFTNVRVAVPDGNPYAFDLAPWKPGAPLAVAAGTTYRAVDASACATGTWKPTAADLTAASIFYAPCNVQIEAPTNTTITSTFLTTGDITLTANKITIRPVTTPAAGVSLAATNVSLDGENLTIQGAIQATGRVNIRGNNATTACLVVGTQVKVTGNMFAAPNGTCPA